MLGRNDVDNGRLYDDELASLFSSPKWDQVNKVFVVGACYSGGFVPSLTRLPHAAVIASAAEGDFSWAGGNPTRGLLGIRLAQALRRNIDDTFAADADKDGVLTLAELATFLHCTPVGEDQGYFEGVWDNRNEPPPLTAVDYATTSWASPDFSGVIGTGAFPEQVMPPTFTPGGGSYTEPQSVSIACLTDGATIHYTTDGRAPSSEDPSLAPGQSVLVDRNLTLKAKAFKAGFPPSDTSVATYTMATVSGARSEADGATVQCYSPIVTAAFAGCFYVEAGNRSSGIRVEMPDHGFSVGQQLFILTGTVRTDGNEERYLDTAWAMPSFDTEVVAPVAVTNRALGGGDWFYDPTTGRGQKGMTDAWGLNNIGLLVRTWGKVVEIEPVTEPALPTWFKIDDGSGLNVRCAVPSGVTINQGWTYVGVSGISSCEKVGNNLYRLIRVRTQGDIRAY
jgi:hypothetical protein